MDDWNDFGGAPAARPPARNPAYGSPDSAPSSMVDTASDASVGLLPSSDSHSSSYSPPRSAPQQPDPARENNHSSFLSSLPFVGAAARARKSDRQAAAAAAAARAAAALADGVMAAPSVVVPPQPPSPADDRIDDMEGTSIASDSDEREPPTRMMPRTVRNAGGNAEADHDSALEETPFVPRRGGLDDVPDDFELNIEGFRYRFIRDPASIDDVEEGQSSIIASSMLRPGEKNYTKLEVISAKQIKNLVHIFNSFALISVILTICTVAIFRTQFMASVPVPLPGALLTDEQIENAIDVSLFPANDKSADGGRFFSMDTARQRMFPVGYDKYLRRALAAEGVGVDKWGFFQLTTGRFEKSRRRLEPGSYRSRSERPVLARLDNEAYSVPESTQASIPSRQDVNEVIALYWIRVTIVSAERWYRMISHSLSLAFGLLFVTVSILYGIRLLGQGLRNVTHEQSWVFLLNVSACLYFNPVTAINTIFKDLQGRRDFANIPAWFQRWADINFAVTDAAFAGIGFFYLWMSLHSYRILDPTKRLGWRFYLPKLATLVPYATFRIIGFFVLSIYISEVPMMGAPIFAFTFVGYRVWRYLKAELLYTIAVTLMDMLLVGVIVYEAVKTTHVLEKAPYMKYRTKRVGYRFFLYINFVFYPLFIILQLVIIFARPRGGDVASLTFSEDGAFFIDAPWWFTMGTSVLTVGYVLVTTYVHLPYNCVGMFKCWFQSSTLAESVSRWSFSSSDSGSTQRKYMSGTKTQIGDKVSTWANDEETPRSIVDNDDELQQQIVEPITYRKRESKDNLELKANCFTMQTHVIMFNFAWYVYYHGTPKLENFRPRENPLPFDYSIVGHVTSLETDTQALVIDCSDRIIVAFKGTTSMRNLKTSLRMSHEYLRNVVNCSVYGEDETARLKRLFGRRYLNGKIHKGFAIAYKSVADEVMEHVRQLRSRRQRPVFLTGHSLGGALATICSLDLWVKLDVSRREIFVSTFGSPRVGNQDFASVYKEVVPLHWRIVVDPDMVAKLPNVGYTHVGKKVVLTPHGEMIIDPNALEQRPWTGETAGFAYHRKASYLLAMRAWCVRNHGMTYTPVFWPFPVRREDRRRFAGAFSDEDGMSGRKVASKIIRMDAMVDALGVGDAELANMAVVEKWGRLTRRLLLSEKLATGSVTV